MKDIYNFLQLTENLSTSGTPTPEQLSEVAEAGYRRKVDQRK